VCANFVVQGISEDLGCYVANASPLMGSRTSLPVITALMLHLADLGPPKLANNIVQVLIVDGIRHAHRRQHTCHILMLKASVRCLTLLAVLCAGREMGMLTQQGFPTCHMFRLMTMCQCQLVVEQVDENLLLRPCRHQSPALL
jgi:hypothetical protein